MVSIEQQTLKAGLMPAQARPAISEGMMYVGFWRRFFAIIIDSFILVIIGSIIGASLLTTDATNGAEVSFSIGTQNLIPTLISLVYLVVFWVAKGATPGKMALGMRIVDAKTGQRIGVGKALLRYFGYFVSGFVLALGFLWVAFDRRKQGLHDKIAGTVVVTPAGGEVRRSRGTRHARIGHSSFDRDDDWDRDNDWNRDDNRDNRNDSDFDNDSDGGPDD